MNFFWSLSERSGKKNIPVVGKHCNYNPCTRCGQEVLSSTLPHYPSVHRASALSLVYLITKGNGGKRSKQQRSRSHVRIKRRKSLFFYHSSTLTFCREWGKAGELSCTVIVLVKWEWLLFIVHCPHRLVQGIVYPHSGEGEWGTKHAAARASPLAQVGFTFSLKAGWDGR